MTPSLFFRIVSVFAAIVAIVMGVLGVMAMSSGNSLPGILLLALACINAWGWRVFRTWSARMRG